MKRLLVCLLALCLLCGSSAALAAKKKEPQPIPERYAAIGEDWNATTAEELHLNILAYWKNNSPEEPPASFTPTYRPCSIRFGGTTKELIEDKKNWDLAIVSSKDVNLQRLADEGLIMQRGYNPSNRFALHQWLLPAGLQALLPQDPLMLYYVYCYDVQADDTTLLICQADIGRKQNDPRSPFSFADEIMDRRSAERVRALEGLRRVRDWTEAELLARADEWDMATLMIDADAGLESLNQAGLLYDFSQDAYFVARTASRPLENVSSVRYRELPKGIFDASGRMIAVPYLAIREDEYAGQLGVMVLNAQGPAAERAHAYAVHWMKSMEWAWTTEARMWPHGWDACIYRDDVDW